MATPTHTKRKRTEDIENEPATLQRGDPWFEDGNIVLQAELTQFKVYGGILSSKSDIFKDMFAMPKPQAGEELVEGCPVVHMMCDTAQDWHHVLKALCDRCYTFVRTTPLPLAVVAAFLRLGMKYNISTLTADAMERLSYEFPTTMGRWDSFDLCSRVDLYTQADYIDVVNLAKEIQLPHFLPTAFLHCILIDDIFECVLKGVERQDGSHAVLSGEEQKICLLGWENIVNMQAETTFAWRDGTQRFALYMAICTAPGSCGSARTRLGSVPRNVFPGCEPFAVWDDCWEAGMCAACVAVAKESHDRGREEAWARLPSMFGLPSWEELLTQTQ
ncbi:hypothetical protein PILCRDRAFT_95671 [Piloderma croceum F 1598]|uniref:BTB domain-containing protein n=1 Tax=Piloderma croceum (strain F 1598) TaxID=765440 RepID=A0A0C3CDX2_PILCF|nr:hypothetical protein PILCRDRAFT_95671 [Piloderma croceum F 1598]